MASQVIYMKLHRLFVLSLLESLVLLLMAATAATAAGKSIFFIVKSPQGGIAAAPLPSGQH